MKKFSRHASALVLKAIEVVTNYRLLLPFCFRKKDIELSSKGIELISKDNELSSKEISLAVRFIIVSVMYLISNFVVIYKLDHKLTFVGVTLILCEVGLAAGIRILFRLLHSSSLNTTKPDSKIHKANDLSVSFSEDPPTVAEWLMMIISKPEAREGRIGDLEQQFQANVKRFGLKRAKRLYWAEVIRAVGPLIFQAIKRLGLYTLALAGFKKWIGL